MNSEVTPERLFMLSKTSVSVQGSHLLVKLRFPLNSLETFVIHKMHSLPVARELHAGAKGYMSIQPKGIVTVQITHIAVRCIRREQAWTPKAR